MVCCVYCGAKNLEENDFCLNCGKSIKKNKSNYEIAINKNNKTLFQGRYSIIKLLGSGGMGKVYLAKNIKLGTYWAIKIICKNSKEKFDFLAEPNIMKKLNHPSIVRIFDIEEDDKNIYIIEDYIEGITLGEALKKKKGFDEKIVISWTKQICEALQYLHSLKPPIIYRDMKPSNLMVTKDGKIKIIDFGIAREYKKDSDSDTNYIGTRGYAAPEQYGTSQTDARTDIYSLGVTLYHLVTGKSPNEPPYEIKRIREINQRLSSGLEYIIGKCTEQDPKRRYQSVAKLIYDINNIEKFNFEYRKKVIIKDFKIILFISSMALFSYITRAGFIQLNIEKVNEYNSLIENGNVLLAEKKYDNAVETFKLASKKIPEKMDAYIRTADSYLKTAQYDKCIDYVEKELNVKIDKTIEDPNLTYILGTAYYNKNDFKSAANLFEKASKFSPNQVDYYRDWAVSLAKMGNVDEAVNVLNKIKEKNISEEVTWYVSGEIFAAKKNLNEAINNFEKCVNQSKDENIKEKAIVSEAEVYRDNKNKLGNDAISNEITILEKGNAELKEKNNLIIVEMLGEAYYQGALIYSYKSSEYYNKAIEKFQLLLNSGYERPYIYRNIAIIYQQLGDFKNSEEMLLKMKKIYPDDYTCYLQLALLYADIENSKPNQSRNYEKTYENYKLAIKFSPDGVNNSSLKQLTSLINDLKLKKWIQ